MKPNTTSAPLTFTVKLCLILLYLIFALLFVVPGNLASAQVLTGKTFIVSRDGSDTNPGTTSQPMATLEAARDAARMAGPGNHHIIVRPGEYFLTRPFELDSRDNGLTIEADTSGKVVIYGGALVTGWRRDGEKFWCADLPGVKEMTWDFRALVVNGRMPERARMPESGTFIHLSTFDVPHHSGFGFERRPTQEELTTMKYDPKDIPETLDIRNAEVRVYHMWDESLVGVVRNDIQQHQLIFSTSTVFAPGAFGVKKYIISNTREGMTKPGLWYLDRTAGKLVYWPLEGEDMASAKIFAPKMERIIRITGEPNKKAENITIRGLVLQATTIPLKPAGFGAASLDGAISITNTNQCTIDHVEIFNVGGLGISAGQMNNCRIIDCHIHNTGGGGARINGNDLFFARNHIHDAGIYFPSAAGLSSSGSRIHIYRNEINDVPYSGMIISGSDFLIEENLIYRVMREVQDGGAIYTGNISNCILRGNVARDISAAGTGFGVSSYYLDENSRDCLVEKNISINVSRPIHNHMSRNSIIRDNLFINDEDMILSFQTSAKFAFENNTIITPGRVRIVSPNAVTSWKGNKLFSNGRNKNNIPQAFTIDSAMPYTPIPGPKSKPIEVVRVLKSPTLDGELAIGEWPGEFQRLDREPSRLSNSGAPVVTKLFRDDKYLYIGAMIAMKDIKNISQGDRWEKDDGIEISISGFDKGKPEVYVVRSYVNGTVHSVTDAGVSAPAADRLGKGIRYVSKIIEKPTRGWIGEWAIPLDAIGIKPKPDLKVPFNMCAFVNEYDNWHCWEGTQGETWKVDKAGTLQFK